MKNKKIIIIIVIAILAYFALLFFLTRDSLEENYKVKTYNHLLLGYDTALSWHNNTWEPIVNFDEVLKQRTFNVYVNNQYAGDYTLELVKDTWQFYDQNNRRTNFGGDILAVTDQTNLEVVNYTLEDITEEDIEYINQILNNDNLHIDYLEQLSIAEKIIFDFDNDHINETLYNIATIYSEYYSETENVFQLLLLHDENGDTQIIKEIVRKRDEYNLGYGYLLSNIIRIDNSNNYDIIVKRFIPYGNQGDCHLIYSWNNGTYENVNQCE